MSLENTKNLRYKLYSGDWKTSLAASESLAKLKTSEAISILIEALKSDNNWIRNAAALGIMNANDMYAFKALLERVKELGVTEDIGTLVYALTVADCSKDLSYIIDLYFTGNFEVTNAVTTILNEQNFILTANECKEVDSKLKKHNYSTKTFNIKYTII